MQQKGMSFMAHNSRGSQNQPEAVGAGLEKGEKLREPWGPVNIMWVVIAVANGAWS